MKRCPSLAKCREGGAAEREVTCGSCPDEAAQEQGAGPWGGTAFRRAPAVVPPHCARRAGREPDPGAVPRGVAHPLVNEPDVVLGEIALHAAVEHGQRRCPAGSASSAHRPA